MPCSVCGHHLGDADPACAHCGATPCQADPLVEAISLDGSMTLYPACVRIARKCKKGAPAVIDIPLAEIAQVTLVNKGLGPYIQILRHGEAATAGFDTQPLSGTLNIVGNDRASFVALFNALQTQCPAAVYTTGDTPPPAATPASTPSAPATKSSPGQVIGGCAVMLLLAGGLIWGGVSFSKAVQRKATVAKARATAAQQQADAARADTSASAATQANTGATAATSTPSGPLPLTEATLLAITKTALRDCNRAGVDRAQWARVKSSRYGPHLEIHFAADDNFTHEAIRDMVALRTWDLLRALREQIDLEGVARVSISATFSLTDRYGNAREDDIMRLEFGRSTLRQLNWDNISVSDQVFRAADSVWIAPCVAD